MHGLRIEQFPEKSIAPIGFQLLFGRLLTLADVFHLAFFRAEAVCFFCRTIWFSFACFEVGPSPVEAINDKAFAIITIVSSLGVLFPFCQLDGVPVDTERASEIWDCVTFLRAHSILNFVGENLNLFLAKKETLIYFHPNVTTEHPSTQTRHLLRLWMPAPNRSMRGSSISDTSI